MGGPGGVNGFGGAGAAFQDADGGGGGGAGVNGPGGDTQGIENRGLGGVFPLAGAYLNGGYGGGGGGTYGGGGGSGFSGGGRAGAPIPQSLGGHGAGFLPRPGGGGGSYLSSAFSNPMLIAGVNSGDGSIQIARIPEPSTWLMAIVGFAGLGWLAHLRARKPKAA